MHYLGPGLDLVFTDETLLDARRTQRAGGDVAARPEQRVPLHVRAHHTLLQGLVVAVQRRAAGAHLPAERHGGQGETCREEEGKRRRGREVKQKVKKREERKTWQGMKMDESRKEPKTEGGRKRGGKKRM